MVKLCIYSDGGYRMSLDRGAWAYILTLDDVVVKQDAQVVLDSTNNCCEYLGIIEGIMGCVGLQFDEVEIVSDSQLVVSQISKGWKVNNVRLRELHAQVMAEGFKVFGKRPVVFTWNPRESEMTSRCDSLCDSAIDNYRG